jgi:hypothetical protein
MRSLRVLFPPGEASKWKGKEGTKTSLKAGILPAEDAEVLRLRCRCLWHMPLAVQKRPRRLVEQEAQAGIGRVCTSPCMLYSPAAILSLIVTACRPQKWHQQQRMIWEVTYNWPQVRHNDTLMYQRLRAAQWWRAQR